MTAKLAAAAKQATPSWPKPQPAPSEQTAPRPGPSLVSHACSSKLHSTGTMPGLAGSSPASSSCLLQHSLIVQFLKQDPVRLRLRQPHWVSMALDLLIVSSPVVKHARRYTQGRACQAPLLTMQLHSQLSS